MSKLKLLPTLCCLLFLYQSCSPKPKLESYSDHLHDKSEVFYTCAMHPQIKEKKPGKCPICHMNLTKIEVHKNNESSLKEDKEKEPEVWVCKDFPDIKSDKRAKCPIDGTQMILKTITAKEVIGKVKLRKAQVKHFKADVFPVTKMKMTKNIRLLGSVYQSEEKESNIPARVAGRVEKVYVKSTGSLVRVGDPVVDLYSPKLISAGEEYILAKKSYLKTKAKEFKDLLLQSEERLKLWGIKESQFEKWFNEKKVPNSVTIFSSSTGIVRKRNATVGKYFQEGQYFFELSDLSEVWVEMDVYEYDSNLIQLGQKVSLNFSALPGETLFGEINFINPVLDQTSRTLKVRTTIENNFGKLKPGMIATAVITIELDGMPVVVPRSAIIDTGKRKVVWVQKDSAQYEATLIKTGFESDGYVEVRSGLTLEDKVVIEGNFLLDAQAQLFGGYEDIKEVQDQAHNH